MGKRLSRKGFSLVEVLIAIGVVATGMMALMAVFITGTRSNQHGQQLSRATYYARKISEIIRAERLAFNTGVIPPNAASGLNDPVGTFRPLDEPPTTAPAAFTNLRMPKLDPDGIAEVDGTGEPILDPADDKFERSIQMTRRSTVATSYQFNLIEVDVTIRWQGGKVGDGMRKVTISSIVKAGG